MGCAGPSFKAPKLFLTAQVILQKIVGSKNARELRRIQPTVERIKEIEEALQTESREKLLELIEKWQKHLARYHELEAPAKPVLERAEHSELEEAASAIDARLPICAGNSNSPAPWKPPRIPSKQPRMLREIEPVP